MNQETQRIALRAHAEQFILYIGIFVCNRRQHVALWHPVRVGGIHGGRPAPASTRAPRLPGPIP